MQLHYLWFEYAKRLYTKSSLTPVHSYLVAMRHFRSLVFFRSVILAYTYIYGYVVIYIYQQTWKRFAVCWTLAISTLLLLTLVGSSSCRIILSCLFASHICTSPTLRIKQASVGMKPTSKLVHFSLPAYSVF